MLKNKIKAILLPLDLTKETGQKVKKSIEFAQYFKATIHLLSIIQKEDKDRVDILVNQLKTVEKYIEDEEVKCSAELIEKIKSDMSLGETIIDYAEKIEANLIVIMAQRENDTRGRHIGIAAQEIIARSNIPVLTIPPGKK